MLDRSLTCTDGFQLLPLSSCADVSAATARWADVRAVTARWRCVLHFLPGPFPAALMAALPLPGVTVIYIFPRVPHSSLRYYHSSTYLLRG